MTKKKMMLMMKTRRKSLRRKILRTKTMTRNKNKKVESSCAELHSIYFCETIYGFLI